MSDRRVLGVCFFCEGTFPIEELERIDDGIWKCAGCRVFLCGTTK